MALNNVDATTGSKIQHYLNGVWRFTTLSQIFTLFSSTLTTTYRPAFTKQGATPTTGATVTVTDGSDDIWLKLFHISTISSATIKLPALANARDGQEVLFYTASPITSLSWDGNGASVAGAPSAPAAHATARLKFDSDTSTWYDAANG